MNEQLLTLWSDNLAISLIVWWLLATTLLYFGRKQAHQIFQSSGRALYRSLRLWSFSLAALEKRVYERNKEVLLAQGAEACERSIEREFERVHLIVQRDLGQYPALHRQIKDAIEKVELDYQKAADAAPLPPAWKDVVETITSIPPSGDPAVAKVLQNIKDAVEESHNKTLKAYKQASAQRHKLLGDMRPYWRSMLSTLETVDNKVNAIDERAKAIDAHMAQYRDIRASKDSAASALATSALTQFFISGLVLVIAGLGGLINFQLIALPMSEMVGGTSYIGSMKTSDIAALVIILIEIAMGLFLVESLRITNLFPIIGAMDDRLRKRMVIITFAMLTILATIEASLAYMRDLLALDREALNQTLSGAAATAGAVQAQFRWIPSLGQMVMGFILPFALAFIAIPLESFIHSVRVVLGAVCFALLRALRATVRILGGVLQHLFRICTHVYDVLIVLPLGIERLVKPIFARRREEGVLQEEAAGSEVPWDDAPVQNTEPNLVPKDASETLVRAAKPASKTRSKRNRARASAEELDFAETLV